MKIYKKLLLLYFLQILLIVLLAFLDIHPKKKVFLFDSFHFNRLKEFIIQDDRKIINVLMYSLRKFDKIGNINKLISKIFSMSEFGKIKKNSIRYFKYNRN